MSASQGTTQVQPATPRTAASLRAEINATQATLTEAIARRVDADARREATTRPGEKARLGGELRRLDGEVDQLTSQLAGLRAQLRLIEAGVPQATTPPAPAPARVTTAQSAPVGPVIGALPPPPTFGTTTPPPTGLDRNVMLLGGVMTVFVLAPLAFALAWRLVRRAGPPVSRTEVQESNERLRRMEQAIDTIAVEVERISENQRFLTNTIASETKVRLPK
jgi:hypothetical protein